MDNKKIVFIIANKRGIFGSIDGNMRILNKMTNSIVNKTSWMPAFAGMTMHVGGNSH